MKVTDELLLETAKRYGIAPGSLKSHAFALFDQGLSRAEVRYLLMRFRNPEKPRALAETIRRYELMWQERRAKEGS
ncbi:MAG: hypothetical protein AB1609_09995 [Bacillota bacterium]